MLTDFVKMAVPEADQLKSELKAAQEKLFGFQTRIKEAKLPVKSSRRPCMILENIIKPTTRGLSLME